MKFYVEHNKIFSALCVEAGDRSLFDGVSEVEKGLNERLRRKPSKAFSITDNLTEKEIAALEQRRNTLSMFTIGRDRILAHAADGTPVIWRHAGVQTVYEAVMEGIRLQAALGKVTVRSEMAKLSYPPASEIKGILSQFEQ